MSEQNNTTQSADQWRDFVLLPASDVPMAGSRTEIIVTPSDCLRVEAKVGSDGLLLFRLKDV